MDHLNFYFCKFVWVLGGKGWPTFPHEFAGESSLLKNKPQRTLLLAAGPKPALSREHTLGLLPLTRPGVPLCFGTKDVSVLFFPVGSLYFLR